MKKVMFLATLIGCLCGCSSVSQPIAEVPLVDNASLEPQDEIRNDRADSSLYIASEQLNQTAVTIDNISYSVGRTFYAASGFNCKFLTSASNQLLYCYDDALREWRRVNSVLVE